MLRSRSTSVASSQAFTLIELLIVIAIIAILSIVVVLVLNPAQLLMQGRDSNRVSDLATINTALGVYSAQGGTSFGSSNVVYVSIPDPAATSTAGDQCQGLGLISLPTIYSYHCAASSTYRLTNGTGWIPVNFATLAGGSPLGVLPVDPMNQASSNLYYTYDANGTQFQLGTHFESQKYIPLEANSGGTDPAMYTAGTNLSLTPLAGGMIGYWPLNEGSGTTAYDYSGNNATGTYNGGITWVPGKPSKAMLVTSTSTYVSVNTSLTMGTFYTISSWIETTSTAEMPVVTNRLFGGNEYYGMGNGKVFSYGCSIMNPGPTINDGNFHLIIFTQTPSLGSWYVDGSLVGTIAVSSCTAQNAEINIGSGDPNPGEYFNGAIEDVRIYDRALSASEISAMYAGGK